MPIPAALPAAASRLGLILGLLLALSAERTAVGQVLFKITAEAPGTHTLEQLPIRTHDEYNQRYRTWLASEEHDVNPSLALGVEFAPVRLAGFIEPGIGLDWHLPRELTSFEGAFSLWTAYAQLRLTAPLDGPVRPYATGRFGWNNLDGTATYLSPAYQGYLFDEIDGERGTPDRREYIMDVELRDYIMTGYGVGATMGDRYYAELLYVTNRGNRFTDVYNERRDSYEDTLDSPLTYKRLSLTLGMRVGKLIE